MKSLDGKLASPARAALSTAKLVSPGSETTCEYCKDPDFDNHFDNHGVAPLGTHEAGLLERYDSHDLQDLDSAKLMNRIDTKFVVPRQLLSDLLQRMQQHYTALEIDTKRIFRYLNTYYDSDDFKHYLAHHNGKLNRYKVRRRTYLDSETSFLEVKFKNNKKRTVKSRVPFPGQQQLTRAATEFLTESGLQSHADLKPVQVGSYSRIALANEARCERLTIDCDLTFHDLAENCSCRVGPWIVLELKQARLDRSAAFFAWAREHGMRKSSFSKYCMGVYFTGSRTLKRNNFHTVARQLKVNRSRANSPANHTRRQTIQGAARKHVTEAGKSVSSTARR